MRLGRSSISGPFPSGKQSSLTGPRRRAMTNNLSPAGSALVVFHNSTSRSNPNSEPPSPTTPTTPNSTDYDSLPYSRPRPQSFASTASHTTNTTIELQARASHINDELEMNEDGNQPLRPVSMMLPRTSRFDTIDENTSQRNSDSQFSMSTRSKHSKSRGQSINPHSDIDFRTGVMGLTPYRNFYTNLTLEAKKLRHLDDVLALQFSKQQRPILEDEEEESDSEEGRGITSFIKRSLSFNRPSFTTRPSRASRTSSSSSRPSAQHTHTPFTLSSSANPTVPPDNDGSISSRLPPTNEVDSPTSSPEMRPSRPSSKTKPPRESKRGAPAPFFFDLKKRLKTENSRITRAAVYIKDAIHERPIKTHRSNGLPMQVYVLLCAPWYRRVLRVLSLLHMVLAFFEPAVAFPEGITRYPNSLYDDATVVSFRTCLWVESIIVAFYTIDIFLNVYCAGLRDYFGVSRRGKHDSIRLKAIAEHIPNYSDHSWMPHFKLIASAVFIVDLYFAYSAQGLCAFRYSRMQRPLYSVVWTPELRRWAMLIARTVPNVWELLVLMAVVLGVFAVSGVVLFGKVPEISEKFTDPLQNFESMNNAFIAMYVLFTTENYPDIMQPAYDHNQISGVFFIMFLMIVMFFLGNLAVPTLYRAFKMNHHREALHGRILERTALLAAFQLLDVENKGVIELPIFKRVLMEIRPDMFKKSDMVGVGEEEILVEKERGVAKSMFRELCQTDPEKVKVYPIDWFRCCEIILVTYKVSRSDSLIDEWTRLCSCEGGGWKMKMELALASKVFDNIMLGISATMTCLMATYNTGWVPNHSIDEVLVVWVWVCVVEMLAKLYIFGVGGYWQYWTNRSDCFCATMGAIGMLMGHAEQSVGLLAKVLGFESELSRWFFIYGWSVGSMFINLKTIRIVFRPVVLRKLRVCLTIYPFMLNSLALTLLFLYFWALGGMYMFAELAVEPSKIGEGGASEVKPHPDIQECIHTYTPSLGAAFAEDELGQGSSIDFSDFWASNMRLFQILTGSNWHLIMYATICSTRKKSHAIYFITFHLVAVLILLQIVIAIYVEAFIAFQDKEDMLAKEKEGAFERVDLDDSMDAEDRIRAFVRGGAVGGGSSGRNNLADGEEGETTGSNRKQARRRVGSMPGFVSPLNMVARMDMQAFEESEIEVLRSLAPTALNLRAAAEGANRKQEEKEQERKQEETDRDRIDSGGVI